jgi:hypothetical protein
MGRSHVERNHSSVGLPDQVGTRLEEWCEEVGVTFKIFVTLPRALPMGRTVG